MGLTGWRGDKMQTNIIYNEDCLMLLQRMPNNTINLIYIDPPFNCKRDQEFGMPSWKDNNQEPNRIDEILPIIPDDTGTRNYLRFMYLRIKEMHRVLRDDGSIYVHCDWRVNSYLRLLLDEVFGRDYYINELIWYYGGPSQTSKYFPRKHDTIISYSKKDAIYNEVFGELPEYLKKRARKDPDGRLWVDQRLGELLPATIDKMKKEGRIFETTNGNLRRKQYLDEMQGSQINDVWDIRIVNSQAKERVNYPTQKPEALLERIIKASSNEGDIVADFFCGSGTTLAVAEKLGRKWIGCDSNKVAVDISIERIRRVKGKIVYFVETRGK